MYRFVKKAEYFDQSNERIYEIYWKIPIATIVLVCLGVVLGLLTNAQPDPKLGVWAIVSALWPTGVYSVAELLFYRRLAKLSEKATFTFPPRDFQWEDRIYRKAIVFSVWSYLIVAGFAFALSRS
jgi:hypothetical protein